MKKITATLFLIILMISTTIPLHAESIKVLIVLPNKYGLNTNLYREMFDKFGWEVSITGITPTVSPCPYSIYSGSVPFEVDFIVDSIQDITQYDCIVIASMAWRTGESTAYSDLLNSTHFMDLLAQANSEHLVITTSCAGTRVLAAAGLITGKQVQGTPGTDSLYYHEYIAAGAIYLGEQLPPVTDGNIVTTMRGQYYMQQNCDAMMAAIENSRRIKAMKGVIR